MKSSGTGHRPPNRVTSMIAQRPAGSAAVVQASAESLPFGDDSLDAAMAVLTAHHWHDLNAGLSEMLRVARLRIVMMTFDSEALEEVVRPMWIWQSISGEARRAGRERLAADLESGAWDERYGHLRDRSELDVGLRLVVSELP